MENRRKDILRVKDLCIFEGRGKVPMGKEPLEEKGKGVEREREEFGGVSKESEISRLSGMGRGFTLLSRKRFPPLNMKRS